jgi:hypothetical protein
MRCWDGLRAHALAAVRLWMRGTRQDDNLLGCSCRGAAPALCSSPVLYTQYAYGLTLLGLT